MKKKLVSYMLVVCMLLSMLPTTAWAEPVATSSDVEPLAETPVNLDVANGSIVIDGDGYTQAPATEETAYTGDYVISGTTNANTLTVSGGTEASPLKITLRDASMKKIIIGSSSYIDLTLLGVNSVKQTERDTAIVLPADSTLVLAGDGDFTVTGGGFGNKPIANAEKSKGGTVIQNTTGTVSLISTATGNGAGPYLTKYVLNSGTFLGKRSDNKPVSMTADYFEKNGGTITAKANYFDSVKNIAITQGLYDGKLAPKGDAGIAASARYQLLIGDNRAYWKSSPVTVSYGESNYTYNTDENGNIDFFAPATANTISVKVNETTYELSKADYGNQSEVKYVGPKCTCDTDPGTFILTEETVAAADGVYIYTPTAPKTISLKGVYTPKDACRSPYHTNYLTPTWEITAITKNGAPVGASNYVDYAELNSATGVLTLKYADADYTVSVKGTVGTTNKVSTETLAVAAKMYKATTEHILDVADGNITVTAGTDENEGKVVYTQGSTSFAVAPDKKVTIAGTTAANSGNIIKVDNCSPSFILHNVTVDKAATFVSPILISGDSHAKIYISGTNELVKHISGKVSNDNTTRTYCGIQLLSADAEKPAKVTIDCMEGSDCTDKNCPHKLYVYTDLGAGIGSHGWYNKNTGYSEIFEVNIDGGHIIAHPGNFGTGIGSGWNSTAKFTVNINDGFVEADGGHFAALIGYGRNADSENVEVNISGGIVEATSANSDGYLDSVQAAIQAGVINIFGTDTVVDVIGGIRATQATFISDEAEVSVAEKSKPEGVVTGNPGFVSGTVVVEASASFEASVEKNNSTVIVPEGKMDAVVIGDDGTMTLPAGTVVESADGTITTLPAGGTLATDGTVATEGTKITENTDGTVTVTDKDGNETTITPAEGENVTVNPDGTMELPEGTVVEKPDGTTTTLPNGGTLAADGTVIGDVALDITKGVVVAEAGSGGKTKYTQYSGTSTTKLSSFETDGQIVLVGSGITSNYLQVNSGTANVTLDNVQLKTNGGGSDDANGLIRVTGGTLNLTIKGTNKLERNRGSIILVGSTNDPTNPNAAVLNIDCAEDGDCSEGSCPHSLTVCNTGTARSAIIGAARSSGKQSGTINFNGGKVIVEGGDTAIGTANAPYVYHYGINITGGYVDVTPRVAAESIGIGMGRTNSDGTVVNINIIDGTVKVTNTANSANQNATCPVAIGGGYHAHGKVNITIGSENTDPTVTATCPNGVAIGKSDSDTPDSSGTTMDVNIVSGAVTATGKVGIGYTSGSVDPDGGSTISISGGKVTATGTQVGIGVGTPPLNYKDGKLHRNDSCDLNLAISDDAVVEASGGAVAIGVDEMVSGGTVDIAVSDSAKVNATSENGVALGSTKLDAAGYTTETTIAITSTNVALDAALPIAAATETVLAAGTIYTFETENGTITVKIADDADATADENGTVTLPAGSTVTKDGMTISLPNGGTIAPDGTVTVNGEVTVEDAEGNETTITPPADGENVTVNPDGTMELPEGTVVEKPDGSTTTLPDGGSVSAEGNVTSEGTTITENTDGSVTVTDKDGNGTTVTPPADGENVTVNPDGTMELPEGTVVEKPDGSTTTLPDGGSMDAEGNVTSEGTTITEKENGSVTVTDKDDKETTITPAEGEEVVVKPDGTVEVPAGSEIETESGTATIPGAGGTVTIPADKVDEVTADENGTVTLPAGTTVTKNGETITLTKGGTIAADGTVTDPTAPPENPENPEKPEKPTPKPPHYVGGYYPIVTPDETPADEPTDKPADKPADKPVDKPATTTPVTPPAEEVVTPAPEDEPVVDKPVVDEPVVDDPAIDEPADDTEPSGGNIGLWIGIGIVALAAIVVVLAIMAARKKRK